jgi:predicted nucleic acid-binding protein
MISNSSPLIIFGKINKIDLLIKIFKKIKISAAVFEEVVIKGKEKNFSEAFLIEDCINKGLIEVKKLGELYLKKADFFYKSNKIIDYGEAETICLTLQEKEEFALIDEKTARKIAKLYGINSLGSLGILIIAFKKKLLNEKEIKEILDKILNTNFRISWKLLQDFWDEIEKIKKEK